MSITIITSSFTSTINGQPTVVSFNNVFQPTYPNSVIVIVLQVTITSASTVSFNTPPANSSASSRHTGVVIGSAIGGTVFALLLISGIFLLYRRGSRRKVAFSLLPTAPRSPPLHEQDFDVEGRSQQPSLPVLLPLRGSDSGSIFREEVWPPPNTGSRLQDPLLAASHIDLHSVVDAVMGPSHPRWSSADTSASSEPLLGRETPDGHSIRPSTSGSNQMGLGPQNSMGTSPSQQPVMNVGPSHQPTMEVGPSAGQTSLGGNHPPATGAADSPAQYAPIDPTGYGHQQLPSAQSTNLPALPPGAAPPFTPFLNRQVNRQRRRGDSIQSSGSPPPTDQRADRLSFGPLVVVNNNPERDQDMPLVDLSPNRGESTSGIPKELPPLYHTLPDLHSEPLQPTKRSEGPSSPGADQ